MLSSIHPLGERARNASWRRTVLAHVVGATFGGAIVGIAAGAVGWVVRSSVDDRTALLILSGAAALAAIHEFGWPARRLPSWHRQVNEDWLTTYRDWVYGAGYGVQLGLGVVTFITSSATYLFLLVAALTGSPLLGGVVGAVYGFGRGASVLSTRRITTPDRLVSFHRTMARLATPIRTVAGSVLFGTGAAALAVAIR